MSSKYTRTIRVDDKTWDRGKRIAAAHGTTMSAMIGRYLKGLKETSRLPSEDPHDPMAAMAARFLPDPVPMEKGRHKPIGKAPSSRRAIWVPDVTWEKVNRIAKFHETTVTAIIVRWLRSLDDTSVIKKAGDTPRRYTPSGRRTSSTKADLSTLKTRVANPTTCRHLLTKELMGRLFCKDCGTKIDKSQANKPIPLATQIARRKRAEKQAGRAL
jgi:hypothetical protein